MKDNLIKLCGLLWLFTCCEKSYNDPLVEDYAALFPWSGIEAPKSSYEDTKLEFCSPNEALTEYSSRNKAAEIPHQREYVVRVKCLFKEEKMRYVRPSELELRYINQENKIVVLSPSTAVNGVQYLLESGVQYSASFKVKSGYPMYLLLRGNANQFSSIKAEITATSTDQSVVIPPITTEQAQNTNETWGQVNEPFCNYIILP